MKNQRHFPARHGVAPIEFLMFLPVMIAFAAVTMYVIRIHEAKQRAALNAEMTAIEQGVLASQQKRLASLPAYRGTDSPDLAQLVTAFHQTSNIRSGLVAGRSEVDSGEGVKGIVEPAGAANAELGFLSHAWESDILPFPTERERQPPLTLPESVRGIAPRFGSLDQFAQLASITGGASGGFSGSSAILAKTQKAAVQAGRRELDKLRESIAQMESTISHLSLNPAASEAEIRELERRLRQAREYRDRLDQVL